MIFRPSSPHHFYLFAVCLGSCRSSSIGALFPSSLSIPHIFVLCCLFPPPLLSTTTTTLPIVRFDPCSCLITLLFAAHACI